MNFLGGVLGVAVTFLLAWLLGRPNDRAFRGAAGVMAVGFGLIAGGFLLFALWPKAQENLDLPNKAVLQITGLAVLVVGTLTLPHLLLLPRRERWWHSVGRTLILLLCLFLFALMVLALGAGGSSTPISTPAPPRMPCSRPKASRRIWSGGDQKAGMDFPDRRPQHGEGSDQITGRGRRTSGSSSTQNAVYRGQWLGCGLGIKRLKAGSVAAPAHRQQFACLTLARLGVARLRWRRLLSQVRRPVK